MERPFLLRSKERHEHVPVSLKVTLEVEAHAVAKRGSEMCEVEQGRVHQVGA